MNEVDVLAKQEKKFNEGFNWWLNKPETRFIVGTIPAGDHKDSLMVLLRSAFDAGIASSNFAMMLVDEMTKRKNV